MPKSIDEVELIIFDTETTGLNPASGDRIVELAGLKVKGQQRLAVFDVLVNPRRLISPEAFAVNKITPEMLKDAPGIEVVLPRFLDFIQDGCLCSYNAEFDLSFINNELKLINLSGINNLVVLDVLTMARKLMPELTRYALWFVADKLKIKLTQEHRALSDVEMTWEVFSKLKIIGQEKGISDFTDFARLFASNYQVL
jgi:DNA polymerase III subunit alpha, Gram-positive type